MKLSTRENLALVFLCIMGLWLATQAIEAQAQAEQLAPDYTDEQKSALSKLIEQSTKPRYVTNAEKIIYVFDEE